jgi:hypothetical protein
VLYTRNNLGSTKLQPVVSWPDWKLKEQCDSSETKLRKKYQQKDDLEMQINQARKRCRVDDGLIEERHSESVKYLSARRMRSNPLKQELRVFLEEDQRNSDAYISVGNEEIGEGT